MTRTYGTGPITQVKGKVGVYRFRVFTEDPLTGKRKQVSKTIHTKSRPSKKDLEKQLAAFKAEIDGRRATGASMTFGKVLDDWITDLTREGRAHTTLETYGYHISSRIRASSTYNDKSST